MTNPSTIRPELIEDPNLAKIVEIFNQNNSNEINYKEKYEELYKEFDKLKYLFKKLNHINEQLITNYEDLKIDYENVWQELESSNDIRKTVNNKNQDNNV